MNKLSLGQSSYFFLISLHRILTLAFAALLIMSCFRLFAHAYYGDWHDLLAPETRSEAWMAYWLGLRFDLSALSYLILIPTIACLTVSILGSHKRWWQGQKFTSHFLTLAFVFLFLCLAGDTGYYSYFQDHINVMIFGFFEDDTAALMRTFWKNYPLFTWSLIFIALTWLISAAVRKVILQPLIPEEPPPHKVAIAWPKSLLRFFLPLVILALTARGSLGLFPLSVQDTVVSSRSFLNYLAYNGFHALIRAVKLKRSQQSQWNSNLTYFGYTDPRQAFADYFALPIDQVPEDPLALLHHKTPINKWAETTRPHVLVIVMESFGSAYLKYDSPSFQVLGELKNHFSQDLLSLQFLPSHASTIGSLSSMMISAPQRPDAGFLTETQFLQVPFRTSAAKVFKASGYKSRFVYGGNPGWRDINKFALRQGFDTVEGDVDIEKTLINIPEKHDWGLFDEDVFRYLEKTLIEAKEPQLVLAMTTTNHPPYQTPRTYQPAPLQAPPSLQSRLVADTKLVQSRFQAYQYSNQKLGEFLTRLKNSRLKDKIIVAVTGDHSFWMVNFSDEEHLQKWGVPLYLYLPPAIRGNASIKSVFGSHFDLFPTLYPLALSGVEYDSLGQNLLSPQMNETSMAVFSNSLAMSKEGAILAQKGHEAYAAFRWEVPYERLQGTSPNPSLDLLAKKYKSLMSLLDYYFMKESQRMKAEKNEYENIGR